MKQLILISACIAATSQAFAQEECVKTAAHLTGNQLTLTTSGAKSTTWRPAYVYYERKRQRKNDQVFVIPGTAAKHPSAPLLLSNSRDVRPLPEKYNVSIAQPLQNVTACADSAMTVEALLNVERVASYTGNYPATEPTYRKVSKREYKMAVRKKRKIERKQAKIAKRAEVEVQTKSTK